MPHNEICHAESMLMLRNVDAVRRRPGMYVGDTEDGSGLHAMVDKLVDNAIGQARSGHTLRITITLGAGGSVTVADDGLGMPTDIDGEVGISIAELTMMGVESFAEFFRHTYPAPAMTPRRRRRIGLLAVNALSARVLLRIWRRGYEHEIAFADGKSLRPLRVVGLAEFDGESRSKCGTAITFWPSPDIFTQTEFDRRALSHRRRTVARIHTGIRFELIDARRAEGAHSAAAS